MFDSDWQFLPVGYVFFKEYNTHHLQLVFELFRKLHSKSPETLMTDCYDRIIDDTVEILRGGRLSKCHQIYDLSSVYLKFMEESQDLASKYESLVWKWLVSINEKKSKELKRSIEEMALRDA